MMAKRGKIVNDLADCKMNNAALEKQLKQLGFKSKDPNGMTFQEAMICSLMAGAIKGDTKASREILKYYSFDQEDENPLEAFLSENGIALDNGEEVINNG